MNLRKNLLSGLFWIVLANILVKPFWILGVDRGVQNAVGAESYGFYFAIFNLAYIFNILLDLGVTNFNTRNIAQQPQLIRKHLSGILSIKLILLGLYTLVTLSVGLLLGYSSLQFRLLFWLCVNQFLNSLIIYLRSNFEGLLLFRMDSLLSVLDRLLMIAICGCLLWMPHGRVFRIEWFVYAQTAAYVITTLVALVVLLRKTGLRRLTFSRPFTLAILKQSAPFALLVLLMASYNRLDPVLLERLLPDGDFQAGIYAGAFRLLDALTMIAYLVSVPLLPIYSRLTKEHDREEISTITRLVFGLMVVFSATAAITCSWLSEPLMGLMYHDHVAESAQVFRLLIYGIIPISMTYIFGTLLTANGNLRHLNLLASTALVLNLAVNLVLIPRMASVGSAWASLAAQGFMAVTQMALAMKMFNMKPSFLYTINLVVYVIIIVVANWACSRAGLSWWQQTVAVGVTALTAAFATRLINLKEIKAIALSNNNRE